MLGLIYCAGEKNAYKGQQTIKTIYDCIYLQYNSQRFILKRKHIRGYTKRETKSDQIYKRHSAMHLAVTIQPYQKIISSPVYYMQMIIRVNEMSFNREYITLSEISLQLAFGCHSDDAFDLTRRDAYGIWCNGVKVNLTDVMRHLEYKEHLPRAQTFMGKALQATKYYNDLRMYIYSDYQE